MILSHLGIVFRDINRDLPQSGTGQKQTTDSVKVESIKFQELPVDPLRSVSSGPTIREMCITVTVGNVRNGKLCELEAGDANSRQTVRSSNYPSLMKRET